MVSAKPTLKYKVREPDRGGGLPKPDTKRPVQPGIAQLVARMVRDHEAVGSNPATRTKGLDCAFHVPYL